MPSFQTLEIDNIKQHHPSTPASSRIPASIALMMGNNYDLTEYLNMDTPG
ncbi:hypothetical protein SAMN04487941_3605 [Pontibacter akesuensis]|uniref:Uncharacterized protein n=1 Tax=Pontibacter akesuensis TaxID=388950 RepID=A0A1I7KDQ0_9BACT|nr:hypothetical protein SAMN04487941_3605 [Pontibacter akesuensis]